MRTTLLSLVLTGLCAVAATSSRASAMTTTPTASATTPVVYAMQVPDKQIEVTVNHQGGVRWYRNPVWIAIGAIAIVVILLLLVMAVRGGGGTTIVRD